jgi:hypothetical protein
MPDLGLSPSGTIIGTGNQVPVRQADPRRLDMKQLLAAIAISLFCTAALADPCMVADGSPTGYSDRAADLAHVAQHGC